METKARKFFSIFNETDRDITELLNHLNEFLPFSQKEMGYDRPVTIRFISDPSNAQEVLGKTAFYNPAIDEVSIYTDDRHPKDMMRSISHELVHHAQNCRGEFDNVTTVGEGPYMQQNDHLFEIEREAFEKGSVCFRTWEDNYKHNQMENKKMKIDEQSVREATRRAVRKMLAENAGPVTRVADEEGRSSSEPLTDEEIRAFLEYKGLTGDLTRYVQGDPDLHRAPGTKSPYDKSEPVEAPPEGVDLEDPDAQALTKDEEEGESLEEETETVDEDIETEVTEESQTDREWYNNSLSEALAKRWAK